MSNLAEVMPAMPTQAPATTALSNSTGIFQFSSFAETMQAAQILSNSSLVPKDYRCFIPTKEYGKLQYDNQGNVIGENNPNATANCLIALNMANRMGYDPLMIMQNLYIIEGRPAWSSQFIIAAINACGKFSPLRFEIVKHGMTDVEYTVTQGYGKNKTSENVKTQVENVSCVAWAIEKATGERIESAKIDMVMAIKEGWYQKNGSKWQTMPDQMLRYRAAAFFGRIYAPEILMGIYSADEVRDFVDVTPEPAPQPAAQPKQQQLPCYDIKPLLAQIEAITTLEQVRPLGEHIKELSENPNVNLCGDDLPTLRNALTVKRDAIKAQLESAKTDTVVEAEPVANDEPVSEPKEKATLTGEKKVASDLMKLISGMTLDNLNDVRAELYAAQAQLSEATFNQLDAVLESNLEALTQA
nr:recombinase RecT [Moraxella sp. CTOTU47616]